MLNMLNFLGGELEDKGGGVPRFSPKYSTYSTYSTFLQKEAHFDSTGPPRIQHIQHFSWKKHFFEKMCFFQGKCWICWIFGGRARRQKGGGVPRLSPKHSTYSTFPLKEAHFYSTSPPEFDIFNISPERMRFFEKSHSFCWIVEYVGLSWSEVSS